MGEPLKYRTDFDKHVVTCNFERRGWERWDPRYDDDWHVFWASVSTIKQIFAPENGIRLGDHQIVNHFPNHYELTRKDLMVKNITRWRKPAPVRRVPQRQRERPPRLVLAAA